MTTKPLPPMAAEQHSSLPLNYSSRDELARSLSPLIAVAASQEVEEICQRNHIPSFVDFLRPFGECIEGRVSPRDIQGAPIAIDSFKIRFRDVRKLDEPKHQAILDLANEYVKTKGAANTVEAFPHVKSRNDVDEAYLDTSLDELMPWYTDFRKRILELQGITESETFNHPVAVMVALSSADQDPMATTMQLYNPSIPAFTIDKPYVDPNILRFYVVVHDAQKTTLEHSQAVFEKMKRTFGLHCHLLRMNSRPADDQSDHDNERESIRSIFRESVQEWSVIEGWFNSIQAHPSSEHNRTNSASSNLSGIPDKMFLDTSSTLDDSMSIKSPIMPSLEDSSLTHADFGCCLVQDDVKAARNMLRELVVQSLIPFMERNIQLWNEQVASPRRGITGRFFGASRRLFGSTTRTPSPQVVQTIPATGPNVPFGMTSMTIYPYGSPEAQLRKLADFAFMLRDFKFAHAIYDTVRRDFATEKAYKYHAGSQEMIGICQLLINQPLSNKSDVDRSFELAVQQYLGRCRSPFYAMRTAIMYYELLKARRMWKEVPTALVRMTGEDSDVRSALFLEQAAHCFLRSPQPMVRKYGFHLMMAGHRYAKAHQREHAYRCYYLASLILEDEQWSAARTHVLTAQGRQAYRLGRLEEAVQCYVKALSHDNHTLSSNHMQEFLMLYDKYTADQNIDPRKESLSELNLPLISDSSIHVSLTNTQDLLEREEEWMEMEIELVNTSIARGYFSGAKKALAKQQQDDQRIICAVGERTIVHVQVTNPLQYSITLNDIILSCTHRVSLAQQTDGNEIMDAAEAMVVGQPIEGSEDMFGFDPFELQKLSRISLEARERRTITLSVIPRKEGSIKVDGLHYTLNDLVHIFRPFQKQGKRLNDTKEHRITPTYAPDQTLDVLVTSPMPLLDVAFHNVPETILSGEVVQCVLEINNKGDKGLTGLQLKTSHPTFVCIGHPKDMDKAIYDDPASGEQQDVCTVDNRLFDSSVVSIPLPSDEGEQSASGRLSPGTTTLVPFWVRGDRVGKHALKFLFSYQSEEDNKAIAYRTLRYTILTQVLASLKINAFTRPSATAVDEFVLGVEIENLQSMANFDLQQMTLASPIWEITPLSIDVDSRQDIMTKTVIPPRQTTFAYYKVRAAGTVDPVLCPEAWTSKALSQYLSTDGQTSSIPLPPKMDMKITRLAFREQPIPYNSMPLLSFALTSRSQWRSTFLANQYSRIPREKHPSLFPLYNSGDVDLTLYWSIPQMKRLGHHYILGVHLGVAQHPLHAPPTGNETRTMFEATAKERLAVMNSLSNTHIKDENPMKVHVTVADQVQHDFEQQGFAKVSLQVEIKNCSWNKPYRYILQLVSWADAKMLQEQKSIKPTMNTYPFHWTGGTMFQGVLTPNENSIVKAHCVFQRPGVYDISRWKLTVINEADPEESFVHWPTLPQVVQVTSMA